MIRLPQAARMGAVLFTAFALLGCSPRAQPDHATGPMPPAPIAAEAQAPEVAPPLLIGDYELHMDAGPDALCVLHLSGPSMGSPNLDHFDVGRGDGCGPATAALRYWSETEPTAFTLSGNGFVLHDEAFQPLGQFRRDTGAVFRGTLLGETALMTKRQSGEGQPR